MITEFQTHQLQPSLDVNDDITSTVSFKQLDRKELIIKHVINWLIIGIF